RRHTRFSRDWSSDVCSSDLCATASLLADSGRSALNLPWYKALRPESASDEAVAQVEAYRAPRVLFDAWSPVLAGGTGKRVAPAKIGRASCRERGEVEARART